MAEFWGFAPCEGGAFFASYNSLDWQRIAPISRELISMSYPIWYDYGLETGTSTWREQISLHIDSSHAVILFVTSGIFDRKSSYVINEYEEAREIGKTVIPVFLDNIELIKVEPKYRSYVTEWKRLQCVMGVGMSPASAAQHIADAIIKSKEIKFAANSMQNTQAVQKPAPQQNRTAPQAKVAIGSRVAFGRYPQSSNTPEPIMWRVLDIINGKALMISESLLDCKKYNESLENVTWETCTLRGWLNGEFMNKAFSVEEQTRLSRVKVPNPDNPTCGTTGGNPTEDYVFCLSIDEAKKYFGGDEDRKAKPTALARKNGCYVNSDLGTGWWWLRSPGTGSGSTANVHTGGRIHGDGDGVDFCYGCVRPVVLARL